MERRRNGRYPQRRRGTRRRYSRYTRYPQKNVYLQPFITKRLGLAYNSTTSTANYQQVLNDGNGFMLTFKLNEVANHDDYFRLYDQFKIRAVQIKFIPLANVSSLAESTYSNLLYTAVDLNAEAGAISQHKIRQYQTVKYTPYNEIHTRYFYPRINIISDTTLSGTQPWLGTNQDNRDYYSLLVVPPTISGLSSSDPIYKLEVMYYLSFRSPK